MKGINWANINGSICSVCGKIIIEKNHCLRINGIAVEKKPEIMCTCVWKNCGFPFSTINISKEQNEAICCNSNTKVKVPKYPTSYLGEIVVSEELMDISGNKRISVGKRKTIIKGVFPKVLLGDFANGRIKEDTYFDLPTWKIGSTYPIYLLNNGGETESAKCLMGSYTVNKYVFVSDIKDCGKYYELIINWVGSL